MSQAKAIKKQNGIFYTNLRNPFNHNYFINWACRLKTKSKIILEPFAGANNIIDMLKETGLCTKSVSFDINPKSKKVTQLDTIANFPKNYTICITNPPWLYKSRAKRLGLTYPNTKWDNLYKHCLDLCLANCDYVAILIPASFLSSNIFLDRLDSVIILQDKLFTDTENPVCLALFNKNCVNDTNIFIGAQKIGTLSSLKKFLPKQKNIDMIFNAKNADLGLIAIDNTKEPSIRFCKGQELNKYTIRNTSRSITRIHIDGISITESLIKKLNTALHKFRLNTYDVFMTAFKGIRADGLYRRRLDFSLARKMIAENI